MWLIFIASCIVVALAALIVIWVGSKIIRSIQREDRKFEQENKKEKLDLTPNASYSPS